MAASSLNPQLRETAYALAVDVAAADHSLNLAEARMLDILRERLGIEPDVAEAIDRVAAIRHRTLPPQ